MTVFANFTSSRYGTSLSALLLTLIASQSAIAGPSGGRVVQGSANIEQSSATRTDIQQNSDKAIINWQDFSINRGEHVNFNQPGRSSVTLNRVTGATISNIQGSLTANGNVFLINPNGVIFGKNATIDVAGLVASTANINDSDFMAGRYAFSGNGTGSIVNQGSISVREGGLVALVAPTVRNSGVIQARLGRVALVSGNTFTVDLYGDGLVNFAVDGKVAQSLVQQNGQINAQGGKVLISAQAARSVVDNVINMDGVVKAQSIANRNGSIILQGGIVQTSGVLDTSSATQRGGNIDILGDQIAVSGQVDASGKTGGGDIHIGGDLQGKGQRQRASTTVIQAGANLQANALERGAGGKVVIWSEQDTAVHGAISATGGSLSGDGGFVETSSRGKLDFTQRADVSANNGKAGTWLIDPENITINEAYATLIEDSLNNGSSVVVQTAETGTEQGNIDVNAAISKTAGGDAALSLVAHNNINVNAPIQSTSGALDVNLKAGNAINVNNTISTNGGGVYLSKWQISNPTTSGNTTNPTAGESGNTTTTNSTVVANASGPESIDIELAAAATVDTAGGDIVLLAGNQGEIQVDGSLNSQSTTARGGSVVVSGSTINLSSSASINSSGTAVNAGENAGGDIVIGVNATSQTQEIADNVSIEQGAQITASATTQGNSGSVFVNAQQATEFGGSITAQGADDGVGGTVSIASHGDLNLSGSIDVTANHATIHNGGLVVIGADNLTITGQQTPNTTNQLGMNQLEQLGDVNLTIRTSNDLTLSDLTGANNLAQSSEYALDGTRTSRTVSLSSENGAIRAQNATLQTAGGNLSIAANGANGNIDLEDINTINNDAEGLFGGDLRITSFGDISIANADTGGGNLSLSSQSGSVSSSHLDTRGSAPGDIPQGSSGLFDNTPLSGLVSIEAEDDIRVTGADTGGAQFSAESRNGGFTSTANINSLPGGGNNILAADRGIDIRAAGDISVNNLNGSEIALTSSNGSIIGSGRISGSVQNLTANSIDVAGGISGEQISLTVNQRGSINTDISVASMLETNQGTILLPNNFVALNISDGSGNTVYSSSVNALDIPQSNGLSQLSNYLDSPSNPAINNTDFNRITTNADVESFTIVLGSGKPGGATVVTPLDGFGSPRSNPELISQVDAPPTVTGNVIAPPPAPQPPTPPVQPPQPPVPPVVQPPIQPPAVPPTVTPVEPPAIVEQPQQEIPEPLVTTESQPALPEVTDSVADNGNALQTTQNSQSETNPTLKLTARLSEPDSSDGCSGNNNLAWLQSGIRSAAEVANMGRGDADNAQDVFSQCY